MKILNEKMVFPVLAFGLIGMSQAPMAIADTTGFISIPASAFSEKNSQSSTQAGSYVGNETGTSRRFDRRLFAPINLPHGAIITSLTCGSKTLGNMATSFTLRRNEPQQANIDMATVETPITEAQWGEFTPSEYQTLSTESIKAPTIDNSRFNYYIVASLNPTYSFNGVPYVCPQLGRCGHVNFCRVGYTIVERDPGEGAGKVKVDDRRPGSIEIIR